MPLLCVFVLSQKLRYLNMKKGNVLSVNFPPARHAARNFSAFVNYSVKRREDATAEASRLWNFRAVRAAARARL